MSPDPSVFLEKDNMEHLVGLVFLTFGGLLEACGESVASQNYPLQLRHCLFAEIIQCDLIMSGEFFWIRLINDRLLPDSLILIFNLIIVNLKREKKNLSAALLWGLFLMSDSLLIVFPF